jgi:hypothetical protein
MQSMDFRPIMENGAMVLVTAVTAGLQSLAAGSKSCAADDHISGSFILASNAERTLLVCFVDLPSCNMKPPTHDGRLDIHSPFSRRPVGPLAVSTITTAPITTIP